LDIDGNLVVDNFQVDPSNLTLDSLSNTDITNPENGAYLYYDGSSQKWKDGGSLTTLINSVKTETYPFVKRFSIRRSDYQGTLNPTSGQTQNFAEDVGSYTTHFGSDYANSNPLGIPAPYSGTTKRQRVNINYDWYVSAGGVASDAEFDIQYRLVAKSKGADAIAVGTVLFSTTAVDLTELGSTIARKLRIAGNVTDKLTYFGKIASTSAGFNDMDIETFFYNSYLDETEIKYNTGFVDTPGFDFNQGDTVYFSAERFTSAGQFYEIVNESKVYQLDLYHTGPYAVNGDLNFSQNFDIILPETTTKTDILVQSRLYNDKIGQYHTIRLRKIYGTVENLA